MQVAWPRRARRDRTRAETTEADSGRSPEVSGSAREPSPPGCRLASARWRAAAVPLREAGSSRCRGGSCQASVVRRPGRGAPRGGCCSCRVDLGLQHSDGRLSSSALAQVPTNHVTGSGEVTVRLNGDQATVTVTTKGLDNGAALVHAMHIHAGGKGECPPASAARPHNGHLAISTTDGINYYGPPVQALTTHGDTSVASILGFPRYLTGGTFRYARTITLPPRSPPASAEQRRDRRARHRLRQRRHLQRGARPQRTRQGGARRPRRRRHCAAVSAARRGSRPGGGVPALCTRPPSASPRRRLPARGVLFCHPVARSSPDGRRRRGCGTSEAPRRDGSA